MATLNQIIRKPRKKKIRPLNSPRLLQCPQKKGMVTKIYIVSPKKPNSANRKVARVKLTTGRSIICYIPGEGHDLQEYANVLIKGGKTKDLPGVKYKIIRGVYDMSEVKKRKTARSKYGKKKD